MKWKKHLNKMNARHFAWPAGWDPAETIADELECSPERVREHLAPSIRSGEVEVKTFTIWDPQTERKVSKTGFRIASRAKAEEARVEAPQRAAARGVTTAKPRIGDRITRVRSANKEIGVILSLGKAGMTIAWPSGEKTHSNTSIRRGDLRITN